MASFKVIEPSFEKLTELAKISYQMLWYADIFRRYKDPKDEQKYEDYKAELEAWHKNNLQEVK